MGGKRPGSDYVRQLHLPLRVLLHIKGPRKKGGSGEMEEVIVSGRVSVSQIVVETC